MINLQDKFTIFMLKNYSNNIYDERLLRQPK